MWTCGKCGDFKFDATTSCDCIEFTIIDEDGEKDKLFAVNPETAALKYAKTSNELHDYYLVNESIEIKVSSKGCPVETFIISAEPAIHYSASLQ